MSCSETSVSEQQPLKTKKNADFLGKPTFFARLVQQPAGLLNKFNVVPGMLRRFQEINRITGKICCFLNRSAQAG
jgi:hypothetical protein